MMVAPISQRPQHALEIIDFERRQADIVEMQAQALQLEIQAINLRYQIGAVVACSSRSCLWSYAKDKRRRHVNFKDYLKKSNRLTAISTTLADFYRHGIPKSFFL
jgi:hypothetical protein